MEYQQPISKHICPLRSVGGVQVPCLFEDCEWFVSEEDEGDVGCDTGWCVIRILNRSLFRIYETLRP